MTTAPAWKAYIRTMAMGSSIDASHARICKTIGGVSPKASRAILKTQRRLKVIDAESYKLRTAAIDHPAALYDKGYATHTVDEFPTSDWRTLLGGGHQHINHIGAQDRFA